MMQKIMLDLVFFFLSHNVYWLSKIIQVVVSKSELNCELNEPIVPIDLLYQFSERQVQTYFRNTSTGTSCLRTTVTFLYLRGLRDHWHSQDEGDAHSNDFRTL